MKLAHYGIAIAVVAYAALALTHTTSAVQALIALPGAAGLLVAVWDVVKAGLEHQHRLEERSAENDFILSATSHMAKKAFDKHVEFCEKYVGEVYKGLRVLFSCGPTSEAQKVARDLRKVRLEFVLWLTKDISVPLEAFENALNKMGVDASRLPDAADDQQRSKLIQKVYDTFNAVIALEPLPAEPTPDIAITRIVAGLQDHLGVSELTKLRKHSLAEAVRRIE
jgi:hypothetical protein